MQTKDKILVMLSSDKHTLTDMSKKLGLTLATVSQHLRELTADGAIRMVENPHYKRHKYYVIADGYGHRNRH